MSDDKINIQIIPSPRPETVEQERDYWYALYREIMTLLEPVTMGSSSAAETLQRIIPELVRLRKLERRQPVGFTLVRYSTHDTQGSIVEHHHVFTDGDNFDDVRNSRRVYDWNEQRYSFVDGRWIAED